MGGVGNPDGRHILCDMNGFSRVIRDQLEEIENNWWRLHLFRSTMLNLMLNSTLLLQFSPSKAYIPYMNKQQVSYRFQ